MQKEDFVLGLWCKRAHLGSLVRGRIGANPIGLFGYVVRIMRRKYVKRTGKSTEFA